MEPVKCSERGEAFRRGVILLTEAGIANPVLDASVLMGFVTGEETATALLERSRRMTTGEQTLYDKLIRRRCRHETISRLTGQKEFYSRLFSVGRDVLDPRPETELLAQKALDFIKDISRQVKVLEIGTGSGAVAVTLAAEHRDLIITATDISQDALKTAAVNARRHGVSDSIRFVRADLAACFADSARFDLIVSNPPYISLDEYQTLEPEVLHGDPSIALVAGPEGIEFYPRLAEAAVKLLNPGGHLLVEVGAGQSRCVRTLFQAAGLRSLEVYSDLSGIDRVVRGTRKNG